jgi:hypothetical protein
MEKTKMLSGLYKVLITTPNGESIPRTFEGTTSAAIAISTSATAAEVGYAISAAGLADFQNRLEALEAFAKKQEQKEKEIVTYRFGAELKIGPLKLSVTRESTKGK